jgi:hypothetical protein
MSNGITAPDKLPPNLYVIVNNRIVPLPQPKPTAKPNSDVIRPGIYISKKKQPMPFTCLKL